MRFVYPAFAVSEMFFDDNEFDTIEQSDPVELLTGLLQAVGSIGKRNAVDPVEEIPWRNR